MSTAAWAERYIERFRLALTWSPPGEKGPRHWGWKLKVNAICNRHAARQFWQSHPSHGIGALLEFSRLVSLDVDDVPHTRTVLAHFGVNLDELAARTPCIIGNPAKFRLMFRAPDAPLSHRTLSWPQRENPRKRFCVFELRAGAVSDALPPTIHPDTQQPYRWASPPRHGFPPPPPALLALWSGWSNSEREARALCPWAAPEPEPEVNSRRSAEIARTGPSVIAAFNEAHDVVAILEAHGYVRRGKRFASPETCHAPGLVLLQSGRVFCHHAGDPLGGDHARDAFDVWATLEHNGNVRAAVRAAAQLLGMDRRQSA